MSDHSSRRFPPSVTVARVYERTSAKGNTYLGGRWGGVRVVIMKTNTEDSDGHPIWEIRLSETPPPSPATEHPQPPRELVYEPLE